jgi:hypothetical protein
MAHAFFLGVDVVDETAASDESDALTLTLIEKDKEPSAKAAAFRLDSIHHDADGADPDEAADRIQRLVADAPYIGRTTIIVNRRGDRGQAVLDALEDRGLDAVAATLTEGRGATAGSRDEVGVNLAEHDAVETLAKLYRSGNLAFEEQASREVSHLARSVRRFIEDVLDVEEEAAETEDGQMPGAASSFDTLVTSAAMAAWLGVERSFDPTQHLKENPTTEPPGA